MNNVRIERMLRELNNEPPMQFWVDLFSLKELVAQQFATLKARREAEVAARLPAYASAGPAE